MNITIKDIPVRLHRKLKARAKAHKRSLNREVIEILENSENPGILDREAFLHEVEAFRATLKMPPMSEDFVNRARNCGRS